MFSPFAIENNGSKVDMGLWWKIWRWKIEIGVKRFQLHSQPGHLLTLWLWVCYFLELQHLHLQNRSWSPNNEKLALVMLLNTFFFFFLWQVLKISDLFADCVPLEIPKSWDYSVVLLLFCWCIQSRPTWVGGAVSKLSWNARNMVLQHLGKTKHFYLYDVSVE